MNIVLQIFVVLSFYQIICFFLAHYNRYFTTNIVKCDIHIIENTKGKKNDNDKKYEQLNNVFSLNKQKILSNLNYIKEKKTLSYLLLSYNNKKKKSILKRKIKQQESYEKKYEETNKENEHRYINIYKMENKYKSHINKNFIFLEISKEELNMLDENLELHGSNLNLPLKNPKLSQQYDQVLFLEKNVTWHEMPTPPISCRQTGCPHAYQICAPMYVDNNKFENTSILKIIREALNIFSRKEIKFPNTDVYNLYELVYTCICKKYAQNGFCDETIV
ncbi:conserved Plasmodium protein, unknown function [Plasmodium reichenowi]|uniref:Uncharacterized protein n=1 Tax=Plasmodium reichenowi TaxID=5854 RepID=A0A2P9D7U1_PLARE|nr:conserved Plasmodium protein, unknown function [Plasmodium reichenowi]